VKISRAVTAGEGLRFGMSDFEVEAEVEAEAEVEVEVEVEAEVEVEVEVEAEAEVEAEVEVEVEVEAEVEVGVEVGVGVGAEVEKAAGRRKSRFHYSPFTKSAVQFPYLQRYESSAGCLSPNAVKE
jgi:hypothetical protein